MRFGLPVIFIVLLSVTLCSANTLTDTFNQAQNNCNYSANPPYGNCDVIGDPLLFDIQSATFSTNSGFATLVIYLNSGAVQNVNNQLTLGSFSDSGLTLIPGDAFFYNPNSVYDPSDPNTAQNLKYGFAFTNHGSFLAGDLYRIGGNVSVETAQQALNDNTDFYRRNEAVLMTGSGWPVSAGTVSVGANGDGTTSALYVLTATFPTTPDFLSLTSNGQIGLLFSSADCGNDVIQGAVGQAPEPGPAVMMLIGVGLLAAGSKWRRRIA